MLFLLGKYGYYCILLSCVIIVRMGHQSANIAGSVFCKKTPLTIPKWWSTGCWAILNGKTPFLGYINNIMEAWFREVNVFFYVVFLLALEIDDNRWTSQRWRFWMLRIIHFSNWTTISRYEWHGEISPYQPLIAKVNTWLVVWNHGILWLPIYGEFYFPNWRSHIFQRGRSTTNQNINILSRNLKMVILHIVM